MAMTLIVLSSLRPAMNFRSWVSNQREGRSRNPVRHRARLIDPVTGLSSLGAIEGQARIRRAPPGSIPGCPHRERDRGRDERPTSGKAVARTVMGDPAVFPLSRQIRPMSDAVASSSGCCPRPGERFSFGSRISCNSVLPSHPPRIKLWCLRSEGVGLHLQV